MKCITRLILRVISDYVMALEYRDWATKPYNVKLVSQTIITKQSQLCLQFRVLLNRANQFYTFLVTIVSLKDPNLDNVVFQRYVAEAMNFSSSWENVTITADVPSGQPILLLFEVIIPPESNGFFAAVDDIVVTEEACSAQSSRM